MTSKKPLSLVPISLLWTLSLIAGCSDTRQEPESSEVPPCRLAASQEWRAALASPGGELPFHIRFFGHDGALAAAVVNGEEEAPISGVECNDPTVVLRFAWYDSEITATLDDDGQNMTGTWRRTSPGGTDTTMAFTAAKGPSPRFATASVDAVANTVSSVDGHWSVLFTDEDGEEEARGEFTQAEEGRVHGTFLTPVGDYRFLAGSFQNGLLRLSTFDGAHAFLFEARAQEDGTLTGDFWSRDSYHATWTAHPITEADDVLPDPWNMVQLTNEEGLFRFAFPDTEGNIVAHDDPRFAGKVVQVNIFGTWCPNCNDEAPLLADWHRRYRDQGFEIVGLAYEFTGDPERDREMLRRFAARYNIEYPLLLAGTSDKQEAAATLPDLTAVVAYPTSIFIGRDGKVKKIHTGFSGPGTGKHHEELVKDLESTIEELLAEPLPEPAVS